VIRVMETFGIARTEMYVTGKVILSILS